MEQRVSLITLGVTDLNRSREFYERLGWRRSMAKAEGIVFFQTGGMALALYPRPDLAKDANIAPEGHGFSGVTLAYNARNHDEVDVSAERSPSRRSKDSKARPGSLLGRLFRLLLRSRWLSMGGRLESRIRDSRRWKHSTSSVAVDSMAQSLNRSMTQFFYATAPAARAAPSATIFPCPCPSELASACSARLITSVTMSTGS